jgi:Uma2 family endonuclease
MTLEEFSAFNELPENKSRRFEFIDGLIYVMASPSSMHSKIVGYVSRKIGNYLEGKTCEVYTGLDVHFLGEDGETDVLCPDIFINCLRDRIAKNFCNGSPELIIEVISPSSRKDDVYFKRSYYLDHGVKEYWTIDYEKNHIRVYTADSKKDYTFADTVRIGILDDMHIDFLEFMRLTK